jgi:pimeloyl-ACP methyl ester carboxylesterase/lysophospholipase L1-like esterase
MRLVLFIATVLIARHASAESWQGWNKVEFRIDDRQAFLIEPKQPVEGKPWIWRTEFFGHQPQADLALLEKGFHVAYINMQNLYGGPLAMSLMDAMYARVTGEYKLSKRVVLEGFSRGGLYTLNWAARNPENVACIYNDAPVCDFTSWPGGMGRGKGSPADWERLKKVYAIDDDQAANHKLNPIHQLEPLAKANIPLLHVCGATDDVVPIDENSLVVQKLYHALGGSMTLISKPHCNHHPHSLEDPTRIVNFVLTHTGFADKTTAPLTPFGYDYFELRNGLQRCQAKFEQEKRGRVAFLGGSITAAQGWRDLVCEDLKRRFPQTEFDFVNAGISSLGSTPGAFRFQRDVLSNGPVDLLFEEAAVNDDTNGFSTVEQVRGMEGIVRQALLANPKTDIVLLHFVDPGKIEEIRKGVTPSVIVNHERVAEHYQIPSIDLAREVTERIDAGEFTWEKDFRNLHPTPFGHELYARSIGRLLSAAWKDKDTNVDSSARSLPEPLDWASYFSANLVSPVELVETKKAELIRGWKLESQWKPEGKAGTRPGFVDVPALVAEEAGATMKLTFEGIGVGIFVAAGPDTGTLDFRIDQGEWQSLDLFTQWSPSLHLPWAKMLASELTKGTHELEMRVSHQADQRSKGNAIRIIHFLVNR